MMAPPLKFHPDDFHLMCDRKKDFHWDSLNYLEVMYLKYAMPGLPNKKKGHQSIDDVSDKICRLIADQIFVIAFKAFCNVI